MAYSGTEAQAARAKPGRDLVGQAVEVGVGDLPTARRHLRDGVAEPARRFPDYLAQHRN